MTEEQPHGTQQDRTRWRRANRRNAGATFGTEELGDVVLFDIVKGAAGSKALDLEQASTIEGFDASIKGANSYAALRNSDVVIVTAGCRANWV